MNWRLWSYTKLQSVMTSLGHPPASVFAGGALSVPPDEHPFMIYRVQGSVPRIKDGFDTLREASTLEVWIYDRPGSYDRIDLIAGTCKIMLPGPVTEEGGLACEWIGSGGELADDELKSILKVSSFNLIGAPS
jgi:hypothetical protein